MQKQKRSNDTNTATKGKFAKNESLLEAAKKGRAALKKHKPEYLSAEKLNITEGERKWLIEATKVLATMTPTQHRAIHGTRVGFDLSLFNANTGPTKKWTKTWGWDKVTILDCDSVACIKGWCNVLAVAAGEGADLGLISNSIDDIANECACEAKYSLALEELFAPTAVDNFQQVTPKTAARVADKFLRTGVIEWPKHLRGV